jgi:hypothetical protein
MKKVQLHESYSLHTYTYMTLYASISLWEGDIAQKLNKTRQNDSGILYQDVSYTNWEEKC